MAARTGEKTRHTSRPLLLLVGLVTVVLTVAGCATGQRAQTAIESPAIDGSGANVGNISIRNFSVAPPTGGANYLIAQLLGVIVNNGATEDKLTSVTTSAAKTVTLFQSAADAYYVTNTPSASAAAPSPSASVSSSTADGSETTLTIPAGGRLTIGGAADGAAVILLRGLTEPIRPASLLMVTMTFANAGRVTFPIGVQLSSSSPTPSILPIAPSTDG